MKTPHTRKLLAAALLLGSVLPATAADLTSTWNSTDGNWTDTTKWSTPGAPGTFPNNGSPTPTYDAIQNGGTLTVNQAITIEKYNLTGGANTGAGFALTLNDLLTWTGGSINGSGVLNATGGATLSGGTKNLQNSRVVNLSGTSTWSTGNIDFYDTASLVNTAGGVLTTNFDGILNQLNGGSFSNAGTFTKSAGAGTSTIGVVFTNSGTVNANSGVLSLNNNSTHTGTLAAGAGGTLRFANGTHNLNAGTSFSGAGTISLTGGALTVNAAVASSASMAFNMSGGAINGAGTLTVNGPLTWTGGSINGSGVLNATGGVTLSGGTKSLQNSRVVNLSGTSIWSAGKIDFYDTAALVNTSGSVLTTNFDGNMDRFNGGSFSNAGTFTKNTATGTTTIGVALNNTGIVNVDSGTFSANGGGASTGAWNVLSGTTLNFGGGAQNLNAGTNVSAAGTVGFSGGTTNFNAGTYSVTGSTLVNGGTANFNAAASTNLLNISGGALGGSNTLTVSGLTSWTGGTINGTGTLNATGGATLSGGTKNLQNGRVVNLSGTSTWNAGNIDFYDTASLVNTGGGVLTTDFNGTMNRVNGGSFTNAGTFTKSGGTGTTNIGVSFSNTGTVNVNTGTLAMNNGASSYNQSGADSFTVLESGTVLATSSLNLNGGTLKGSGTVQGSVIAGVGVNIIDPGFSPGILTVNGNVTLSSTSTLAMEIGGLGQGTLYDYLDVNGVLTLAGILDLDMLNGFENLVTSSDVFTLATANAPILGSFSNVASGSRVWTNTHIGFDVWYGAGSIFDPNSLVITGAPEPSRVLLLMVGVAGLVMRRRRTVTKAFSSSAYLPLREPEKWGAMKYSCILCSLGITRNLKTCIAALACLFLTGVSHATTTLFSTLGQTVNGYGTITNDDSDVHQNQSEATDFRTGASASIITGAWFGLINASQIDSKTFLASIYSDNGGTLGTLVGNFDPFIVPSNFNSPAPFGLVAGGAVHATTSGINLAANTNYWVYLHTNEGNDDALGWLSAQPGNLLDAGSVFSQVSATEAKVSVDFGATFLNAGNNATPLYSLEGTQAVPEPSRAVLLMLGLMGLTQRRKRHACAVDLASV